MTVLGIDTATPCTTVGVARDARAVAERSENRERDHSSHLGDLVTEVLHEAGVTLEDLQGIAVSVGPGSFTGIRVGIGFAKGLAFARGLPLFGIGTMDALAAVGPVMEGRVAVCLDARKGEVYLALYERSAGLPERIRGPEALYPEEAVRILRDELGEGVVLGDAAEAYPRSFDRQGLRCLPFRECGPHGAQVALLGLRQLERGAAGNLEAVRAVYIRHDSVHTRPVPADVR